MQSTGILRRVVLIRTDVSEERSVSNNRVTRICELDTISVVNYQPTQILVLRVLLT
jgi:hypothetical protein